MIRTCPHCHEYLWENSPRLKSILDWVALLDSFTTRQVADHFGIKIANANNQIRNLSEAGLITKTGSQLLEGGGVEFVWSGKKRVNLFIMKQEEKDNA